MNSEPSLTAEGEAAWLRFKQHLDWNEGFALVFLFAAHPEVTEIFRKRLADIHRARVTGLSTPMPTQPQGLLDELLPQLLAPPQHRRALQSPYWIDLSSPLDEDWQKARLAFLIRLNEQRETLRRGLDQALILVLPLAERTHIKSLVPDLWAIRHFSLTTEDWLVREPAAALRPSPQPISPPLPASEHQQSLIEEWRRLQRQQSEDRGYLLAAHRAVLACRDSSNFALAAEIAQSQATVARKRCQTLGETDETLRDLSIALDDLGETAQALGERQQAQQYFQESLDIRRQLLNRIGETPEALWDLSIALDNVGNTAHILGHRQQAQQCFQEGYNLTKILAQHFPAPEEYKRLADYFRNRLAQFAQTPVI